ncbi:hypothetical protein QBC32DRAFT_199980, partial [Pseudoneurospora amorphoporcata]
ADQGSDINVINYNLAVKLGLPFLDLAEAGYGGMSLNTSDNRRSRMVWYAMFRIDI